MSITTFLFLFSLLFIQGHCTSESQDQASETTYIRVNNPKVPVADQDFQLNPETIHQVLFILKGQTEEVSIDFTSEEQEPSLYKIVINRNNELDSEVVAKFTQTVDIKLYLDYVKKICQIMVEDDFNFELPLFDSDYKISIEANKYIEEVKSEHVLIGTEHHEDENKPNGSVLFYSVTVGVCVVAVIAIKMVLSAKKRRNLLIEDLSIINNSAVASDSKAETTGVSDIKLTENSNYSKSVKIDKTSLTVNFKKDIQTLNKIEYKSNDPHSCVSTSPTLSNVHQKRYFPVISVNSITSLHEESEKAECYNSESNVSSIVLESTVIDPIAVENHNKNACPNKCCDKDNNKLVFSKPVLPKNDFLELDLDMGMDNEGNLPSSHALKALIKKMQEEGTIGLDNDPSVDSDDEDQYEAPQLPDYFCCMLCFQGKRNTIVGPCRHIFACIECVEDLLETYKICVLCANKIDNYEMM